MFFGSKSYVYSSMKIRLKRKNKKLQLLLLLFLILNLAIYNIDYYNNMNLPFPLCSMVFSLLLRLKTMSLYLFHVQNNSFWWINDKIIKNGNRRCTLTLL